jgi:hypothetical protein
VLAVGIAAACAGCGLIHQEEYIDGGHDRFLSYEFPGPSILYVLRSADGAALWSISFPYVPPRYTIQPGEIVPAYAPGAGLAFARDGRLYYVDDATLHCLDADGAELWQDAGSVFYDEDIPAHPPYTSAD